MEGQEKQAEALLGKGKDQEEESGRQIKITTLGELTAELKQTMEAWRRRLLPVPPTISISVIVSISEEKSDEGGRRHCGRGLRLFQHVRRCRLRTRAALAGDTHTPHRKHSCFYVAVR